MFHLEQALTEWRREMQSAGIKTPATLDELEIHLREEIRVLVSGGMPESEAFQLAVSRLGGPDSVSGEFKKTAREMTLPVMIGSWLWAAVLIALALALLRGLASGRLSLLLFAHIFTLTAGYLAAYLAGGFGICCVCFHLCRKQSPSHRQSFDRAIVLFTQIATVLIAVGVLLGIIWSRQNRDATLTMDPRELGPFCALTWFVVVMFLSRFGLAGGQSRILTAIAGNIVVSLAWFGAQAIPSFATGFEYGSHWVLAVFVAVHLFFLALAGVADQARQLKSS
jgi:hypothetical protein